MLREILSPAFETMPINLINQISDLQEENERLKRKIMRLEMKQKVTVAKSYFDEQKKYFIFRDTDED